MYKKLLLASSLAVVATQGFAAAWVPATEIAGSKMPVHTNEGIQAIADTTGVAVGSGLVKLGAEYVVNDLITFTLSAPKASGSDWETTIKSVIDTDLNASAAIFNATAAAAAADAVTFSVDDDGATGVDATDFLIGGQWKINGDATIYRTLSAVANTGVITFTPKLTVQAAHAAVITSVPISNLTLTLVQGSATSAQYRVSASAGGTTTIGTLVPTPEIKMDEDSLQSSAISMSFSATTASGTAMDALATSLSVGSAKAQFTPTVNKFDGVIDVGQDRKKFTSGGATDIVGVGIAEYDGQVGVTLPAVSTSGVLSYNFAPTQLVASATSAVSTISGDWSFLDDTAATAGTQVSIGSAATDEFAMGGSGCTAAVVAATAALTITDDLTSNVDCPVTFKNVPAAVLAVQSYTSTTKYTFTPSGSTAATRTDAAVSAGAWTLNGATVRAYGVPMGSHVSRFIWINNKGTLDGAFTYTATMNGTSYGPYSLTTVPAKSAVAVSSMIDTDLAARGITIAPSSRATFSFDAPIKQADIVVSAAYKHIADADRVALETSDSLDATGK